MNKAELYRFIGLKQGEVQTVGLFIVYSFFMGVAVAIFYTATTSLFLMAFDRTMLPKAYIAGGLIVYGLGVATNYLQSKLKFTNLVNSLIYFLVLSVAILLICYEVTDKKWFIFFLFVWNRVFVFVNGLTFWSTASKIFNLQQAKRLFGIIGTGEVVSSILSFFSVPLLLKVIGTDQLLYIVAGAVAICILLMSRILQLYGSKLTSIEEDTTPVAARAANTSWRDFLSSPYYLFVFILAMMPVIGLFFVDFMFSIESKNIFPDKELLAGFLGVFFGFCAIFEMVIKTVLYGRVINKFGLRLGITLLPLMLIFSITLAVGYGTVYGTTAIFFAFIVLSRFFMSSVRKSVHEPSFQVLLQPIPVEERAALLSRIEGGPKALGNIVPGVILLGLTSMSFIGTVQIAAFFLLFLIGWYFVSMKIQAKYRTALRALLKKSQSSIREIRDTYYYIARRIALTRKNSSLNYEYNNFKFIVKLAESGREKDRILAAELLSGSGRYQAHQYLIRLLNDESWAVRNAALTAAGSMRNPELLPVIISHLDSVRTFESAAYALLSMGEPILRELGRGFIRESGNTELQLRLVRIIRQIGGPGAVKFLRSVMNYPEAQIRDEVYEALKYLNYHVTITERSFLSSEIDERIGLYVGLIAAQNDLTKYPPWSAIHSALEREQSRILSKIFTLLSLLSADQRYDFMNDLLTEHNQNTQGYLLEILNMTLPEEWKDKLMPLFEDIGLAERLRKVAEFYPQRQLSPEERLTDIVNQHFSRVSCWLKVTALHELVQSDGDNSLLLGAHAVSPDEILAETALYSLLRLYPARFQELYAIMEARNDTFHVRICQRVMGAEAHHDLLMHKVWLLRQTDRFAGLYEDELFPLASTMEKVTLPQGHVYVPEEGSECSVWLVAEGQLWIEYTNGSTENLEAFDFYEVKADGLTSIRAVTDAEVYSVNSQNTAFLQLHYLENASETADNDNRVEVTMGIKTGPENKQALTR